MNLSQWIFNLTGWASPRLHHNALAMSASSYRKASEFAKQVDQLRGQNGALVAKAEELLGELKLERDALQPMESHPIDGTPFNVRFVATFRFLPYKPNSKQARDGIAGRWQSINNTGEWQNCPAPEADGWIPLMKMPGKVVNETVILKVSKGD